MRLRLATSVRATAGVLEQVFDVVTQPAPEGAIDAAEDAFRTGETLHRLDQRARL